MYGKEKSGRKMLDAHLRRTIPTSADRILDAPGLIDDYYLNLLDWSCLNVLAIGLDKSVYLWSAETGDVECLMTLAKESDYIASLKWTQDGGYLAVATAEGNVQLWDAESCHRLRIMTGRDCRVGVMDWDKHILTSGAKDGSIWNHDVRIAQHKAGEWLGHQSEVCGLSWRSDGMMLASGGNDNLVNVWDAKSTTVKFTKANHTAAVKAVSWCPWQSNVLATGGGSHDRTIRFWNTNNGALLNEVDTASQVTSILWSATHRELLSTHGFPHNQVTLWTYPGMQKIIDIPAHETRVLHAALSPDHKTVATVASDENLKFWKVWEGAAVKKEVSVSRSKISAQHVR
jgi:cell division cycle protein 20 (cofactor of APC complex)